MAYFKIFWALFCFFAHLFVPFTLVKVLSFERKYKKNCFFICFFAHLFVPLSVETIKHHDYDRRKTNIIVS